MEGLAVAIRDTEVQVKHIMISGGTPSSKDLKYLEEIYESLIRNSHLPVDVMFTPPSTEIIERLVKWGIHGFAINLEVYNTNIAEQIVPQKYKYGRKLFTECIEEALYLTEGHGRVRSLLLVGLEPIEETLKGVEFLSKLGCDPVLSPFRPAQGTPLEGLRPPSYEDLERVFFESLNIVERYGVKLGPRCIPCQHNTLTFPDGSTEYYYS
jgi:biotin synthase-like enzyme